MLIPAAMESLKQSTFPCGDFSDPTATLDYEFGRLSQFFLRISKSKVGSCGQSYSCSGERSLLGIMATPAPDPSLDWRAIATTLSYTTQACRSVLAGTLCLHCNKFSDCAVPCGALELLVEHGRMIASTR
jgi:hypothetical protein